MELFDEGGLMQEGGTVDPVSGNDVPVGSTQEEVRDDIPAQLSEGEFVMPADVVRYHGLDKMMALRDEAKMGLQRMEDMGQMGNSEEAIIPDGVPFDMEDLEMEDDGLEMNVGGAVGSVAKNPGVAQNIMGPLGTPLGTPMTQVVVYGPDGTAYGNAAIAEAAGVFNYTMTKPQNIQTPELAQPLPTPTPGLPANKPTMGRSKPIIEAASAQFQPAGTKFTPYTSPTINMPSFQDTIGMGVPYVDYDPNKPKEEEEVEKEITPQPPTTERAEAGDGGGFSGGQTSPSVTGTVTGYTSPSSTMSEVGGFLTKDIENNANAFGGNKEFGMSNKALRSATIDQAMYQLGSISPTGAIGGALAKQFGFTNATMNDMAVAGQRAKEAALSTLGFTRASQIQTSQQATMYGTMISTAHAAAKKGEDVTVALSREINNPAYAAVVKDAAVSALKGLGYTSDNITNQGVVGRAIAGYRAAADSYREDAAQSKSSGTVKDSTGKAVTSRSGVVMTQSARDRMNAELEAARTAEAKADALAAERARQRGNESRDDGVTGTPTEDDVSAAKDAADKATQDAEKAGTDYGDEFGNQPDDDSGDSSSGGSGGGYGGSSGGYGDDNGGGGYGDGDSDSGGGRDGGDDNGGGGGGTYICTASYANGIIPRDHFTSLKKYGILLRRNDPYLMKAYDWFGPKLAAKVKDTGWTSTLANLATAYYKARYTNTLSAKQKIYDKVTQTFVWPTLRLMGWVLTKVNK